jgi:hypothetical protein
MRLCIYAQKVHNSIREKYENNKKIENNNPVVESWLCPCPRRLLSWCCGYLAPIVPHTRALGEAGVLRLRACTAPEYKR